MAYMVNDGWVKLWRELLSKSIWIQSTPECKTILITILLLANHEESEWEYKGEKYRCKPGQLYTSIENLAKHSGRGITPQNVRGAISRLCRTGFLTNESTKTGRLITVVNWDKYQGGSTEGNNVTNNVTNKEGNKEVTKHQQRGNKEVTTNKNNRNIRIIEPPPTFSKEKGGRVGGHGVENPAALPAARLASAWNSLKSYGIAGVYKIDSGKRAEALQNLMAEYSPEEFETAIEKVKRSNFLTGKGKKGWRITFDWFIQPENFAKVIEGNYDMDKDYDPYSASWYDEETEKETQQDDSSGIQSDSSSTNWSFQYAQG